MWFSSGLAHDTYIPYSYGILLCLYFLLSSSVLLRTRDESNLKYVSTKAFVIVRLWLLGNLGGLFD
jgi:hypothetical protein